MLGDRYSVTRLRGSQIYALILPFDFPAHVLPYTRRMNEKKYVNSMFRIDRAPRAQMGGLHINCARIKITFFGILRSKAVSCQQIHWTGALPFLSVSAMVNGQQRTLYQEHIQTLDLYFRKFCPSIAGPPQHIVWTMKWCRFFTLGKNKGHVVDIFF